MSQERLEQLVDIIMTELNVVVEREEVLDLVDELECLFNVKTTVQVEDDKYRLIVNMSKEDYDRIREENGIKRD